jgi:transposase
LFADGAYGLTALMGKAATRWVVERTFGWMVRWRRLVVTTSNAPMCRKT